jgi:hypothetical protein
VGGDASAASFSIVVIARGPKPIMIHLAAMAGRNPSTTGCSAYPLLYRDWLQPGATLRLESQFEHVCFQQTYDNFPSVNWSPAGALCFPPTRDRPPGCWFDRAGTMFIEVVSTDPRTRNADGGAG